MPPSRGKASSSKPTERSKGNEDPSKSTRKKSHRKQTNDLELPGVQKLKSQLRQTRRLLAKDNLNADVRVETERRLKSLENDLQLAKTKRKERTMATKYHKVKFFERKKIIRKINQVKKELESEEPASSKARTKLEKKLHDLRVDLNYVLHYPKLDKYIALFPASTDDDQEVPADDETNAKRQRLREDIKSRMESGELHGEPELQTEAMEKSASAHLRPAEQKEKSNKKLQKGEPSTPVVAAGDSVREDDFFDVDGESSGSTSD